MTGARSVTSGGERLRRLRNRCGLTQQVVADRISFEGEGPDKPAISRIETGYNRSPERATLQRIVDAIWEARFSERREIIDCFGYLVDLPLPSEDDVTWARETCQPLLDQYPFPAYLLDCAEHIRAWNHQCLRTLGAREDSMLFRQALENPIFEAFYDKKINLSEFLINIEEFRLFNLRIVKQVLTPYAEEEWCAKLVEDARRKYDDFAADWRKVSELETGVFEEIAARPLMTFQWRHPHSKTKRLTFRLATEHLTRDTRFRVYYYLPTDRDTLEFYAGT